MHLTFCRNFAGYLLLLMLPLSAFQGRVDQDIERIHKITDLQSCVETFKGILFEMSNEVDCKVYSHAQQKIEDYLHFESRSLEQSSDLGNFAWETFPKFIEAYLSLNGIEPMEQNRRFSRHGYIQGTLDKKLNQRLLQVCKNAKGIPFSAEDADPDFSSTFIPYHAVKTLNELHNYLMLEDKHKEALVPVLDSLKKVISSCLGTPWRVVNVRMWETYPSQIEYGPTDWHVDGMHRSCCKIMIYPKGLSADKGSLEVAESDGNKILEGGEGSWVFFKNSELLHRGITGRGENRLAIEVTLIPSIQYDLEPFCAGNNARYPHLPWGKPYSSTHPSSYEGENILGVNIGGGPSWQCPKWVNLEEVTGPGTPHSFILFPNCRFPFDNGSLPLAFTSHNLEHLNIPTVYRVLSETYRVLEQGGDLVIKIPDYEKVLDCWKRRDMSFFTSQWNIESVAPLWGNKGIQDCLDYRAAMIFTSFYNEAYGNPFAARGGTGLDLAYFGPPVVDIDFLRHLIKEGTPSQIAEALREEIYSSELNFQFCHQSAWSRKELEELLNKFGFDVVSFDPSRISNTFKAIPGINSMGKMSTFCWAKKR
ncbi:MAG: hypothetical protein S4CHLAM45_01870 [Chlamydiales bacterium]|nr:hypothetical protein [Chlamydiales bacterium]MCH9619506.1 hypothetical protein [Chlamydiales bacterium]MCH9622310.1 hypothetical protein [Chlamydiales bacterium]